MCPDFAWFINLIIKMRDDKNKLEEIHSYLTKNFDNKGFGLRDGYIFSGITKQIFFDLFISSKSIGLKYPKGNISESKTKLLTQIINEIDTRFIYREYNTTPKTKYSIWEIDISSFENKDIVDLIIKIEKNYT